MRESRTYGSGRGRAMKRTSLPLPRREFITLLGARRPRGRSQRAQQPAMPMIGCLYARSADTMVDD